MPSDRVDTRHLPVSLELVLLIVSWNRKRRCSLTGLNDFGIGTGAVVVLWHAVRSIL